jgi:hypothetical protein
MKKKNNKLTEESMTEMCQRIWESGVSPVDRCLVTYGRHYYIEVENEDYCVCRFCGQKARIGKFIKAKE